MWKTIYISPKSEKAVRIKKLLESEGIIAKNKTVNNNENNECFFEILVPSKEISEAHSIIIDAEL